MTHRTRLSLLTLAVSIVLATVPAVASAGAGFTVPSGNTVPISGYNGEGREYSRRPVLGYGKTWKRSGFTCVSRSSGLTCRRGSHGFFLSRESRRFF